jgi:hypothetical protein
VDIEIRDLRLQRHIIFSITCGLAPRGDLFRNYKRLPDNETNEDTQSTDGSTPYEISYAISLASTESVDRTMGTRMDFTRRKQTCLSFVSFPKDNSDNGLQLNYEAAESLPC